MSGWARGWGEDSESPFRNLTHSCILRAGSDACLVGDAKTSRNPRRAGHDGSRRLQTSEEVLETTNPDAKRHTR